MTGNNLTAMSGNILFARELSWLGKSIGGKLLRLIPMIFVTGLKSANGVNTFDYIIRLQNRFFLTAAVLVESHTGAYYLPNQNDKLYQEQCFTALHEEWSPWHKHC